MRLGRSIEAHAVRAVAVRTRGRRRGDLLHANGFTASEVRPWSPAAEGKRLRPLNRARAALRLKLADYGRQHPP